MAGGGGASSRCNSEPAGCSSTNCESDSGWFFSSGRETEAETDDPAAFQLVALREVVGLAPALKSWLRHPEGTLLRREGQEFTLDA